MRTQRYTYTHHIYGEITQIPHVYVFTFSKSIIRSKINSKINDPVSLKNAIKNKREIYFKLKMFNQMGCIDLTRIPIQTNYKKTFKKKDIFETTKENLTCTRHEMT